jgi:hypothetical protein
MKFFRYRRPSLKTILGVTRAKKAVKKELGITALLKPFRWWPNQKRRLKREVGYESETGRLIRDGVPKPGGCLVVVAFVGCGTLIALFSNRPTHVDLRLGQENGHRAGSSDIAGSREKPPAASTQQVHLP